MGNDKIIIIQLVHNHLELRKNQKLITPIIYLMSDAGGSGKPQVNKIAQKIDGRNEIFP